MENRQQVTGYEVRGAGVRGTRCGAAGFLEVSLTGLSDKC